MTIAELNMSSFIRFPKSPGDNFNVAPGANMAVWLQLIHTPSCTICHTITEKCTCILPIILISYCQLKAYQAITFLSIYAYNVYMHVYNMHPHILGYVLLRGSVNIYYTQCSFYFYKYAYTMVTTWLHNGDQVSWVFQFSSHCVALAINFC